MRWSYIWQCPYNDEGWKAFMASDFGKITLQLIWEERVKGCTRCNLHLTRIKIVYGVGNPERPDVAFVGIGPGVTEDRVGLPYIGPAGELLNKMITAMGYTRADVFICNVLSCRSWDPETGKDVDPLPEHLHACVPVWTSQLVAVQPRIIVATGAVPGNMLLGTEGKTVGDMRKKIHVWRKIPVQVTYHPAGLLRQEALKPAAWEDLQIVLGKLQEIKAKEADNGPLFR